MKSEKIIKAMRRAWVTWVLLTLCFIGIPSLVDADISDILLKFYPYVTAGEEYSNNILLTPNATKSADYITTVNPGLRFLDFKPGNYGIDVDVSGGYIYYAKHHDLSYWNATGRLNSWYAVTPKLSFMLRDYFIRSDAARENVYQSETQYNAQGQFIGNTQPDQFLVSTVRGVQAIYFRNVVEPSIEYRFGRENLVSLLYRNNIYRNENPLFEDSMENTLNPRLAYWFDINNGVSLDYRLTLNTYQVSPDQLVNAVTPRYTYRFDPRTSIFGEYHFEYQDFESPGIDYYVHTPSLGLQYNFSPTLIGIAQGGYYWQIPKQGSKRQGPFYNLSLTQRTPNTQYMLALQGGYTEDYITAQNLGFTKTYSGYGTIQHQLTQRLSVRLTGSMYRYLYSNNNQKDWVWDVRGGPSYLLFRWLEASLEASYRGDNSNISVNDYTEFRGMFTITIFRPGYRPGVMGGPGYQPAL
jgi:Putative beta-barrel porin 2